MTRAASRRGRMGADRRLAAFLSSFSHRDNGLRLKAEDYITKIEYMLICSRLS